MDVLYLFAGDFVQCNYKVIYIIFCIKASRAYSYCTIWKRAQRLMRKGGAVETGTHGNIKGLIKNGADFCGFKSLYIYGEDTDFFRNIRSTVQSESPVIL